MAQAPDASQFVADVTRALAPLADAKRATPMAAYMKNRFAFLGIPAPARRQATRGPIRTYGGDPLAAAAKLWRKPQREFQYVACDLLQRHVDRLQGGALPGIARLVTTKSWWDTVDGLAWVAGEIVRRDPRQKRVMDDWIGAEDFWLRRVALLHQLAFKNETDAARLFAYCLRLAREQEFFIRKAIGWALRQHAYTDRRSVRDFLRTHREALSPLSFREAAKHLGRI